MTRITTPFSQFMSEFTAWLSAAWPLWLAIGVLIVLGVVIARISKARARAQDRIPRYRRVSES